MESACIPLARGRMQTLFFAGFDKQKVWFMHLLMQRGQAGKSFFWRKRLPHFLYLEAAAYDLAFSHTLWEPSRQNVFFTLLLGLLAGELLLKKGGENPIGYKSLQKKAGSFVCI